MTARSLQEYILARFKHSRLQSLYSDFSHLRESNIEGYRANIAAWKTLFLDLILNHDELLDQADKISICSNTLVRQLTINDGILTYKSKGIDKVIDSMVNEDHTMIPYSEFVKKPVDLTGDLNGASGGTLIRSFLNPFIGPAYCNHLTNFHSGTGARDGSLRANEKYVCLQKLRKVSSELKACIKGPNEALLLDHLFSLSNIGSRFDFDCCIQFLSRDTGEICVDSEQGIAYLAGGQMNSTEELKSIADLSYAIYTLQTYCDRRLADVSSLNGKIRELVNEKQHNLAKSQLRIRKIMEKQLNSSQVKLEQLQLIQIKIEEAQNNLIVVRTLESNSNLLKELNEEVSDNSKLDELLEGYSDQIDKTNAISDKLGSLGEHGDEDIERELEALEEEEEQKGEVQNANASSASLNELEQRFKDLSMPKEHTELPAEESPVKQPLLEA
ncbi:DEKNAAC102995 [Brettanomyces naardenensis]|uniref:Vacuolar-sorting protein SNF7 n=1 Tax=Brettanomyces naardenensis TaxID=13370 RepID=A0A448YM47_BRENA|nr:DEKNAAC102995 [Brettanomyces naardenensis]